VTQGSTDSWRGSWSKNTQTSSALHILLSYLFMDLQIFTA
jgi:hypothetical protein